MAAEKPQPVYAGSDCFNSPSSCLFAVRPVYLMTSGTDDMVCVCVCVCLYVCMLGCTSSVSIALILCFYFTGSGVSLESARRLMRCFHMNTDTKT